MPYRHPKGFRDSYWIIVGGGWRRVFRGLRKVVVTVSPFREDYRLTLRVDRNEPIDLGLWAEPRIARGCGAEYARELVTGLGSEAPWLRK